MLPGALVERTSRGMRVVGAGAEGARDGRAGPWTAACGNWRLDAPMHSAAPGGTLLPPGRGRRRIPPCSDPGSPDPGLSSPHEEVRDGFMAQRCGPNSTGFPPGSRTGREFAHSPDLLAHWRWLHGRAGSEKPSGVTRVVSGSATTRANPAVDSTAVRRDCKRLAIRERACPMSLRIDTDRPFLASRENPGESLSYS